MDDLDRVIKKLKRKRNTVKPQPPEIYAVRRYPKKTSKSNTTYKKSYRGSSKGFYSKRKAKGKKQYNIGDYRPGYFVLKWTDGPWFRWYKDSAVVAATKFIDYILSNKNPNAMFEIWRGNEEDLELKEKMLTVLLINQNTKRRPPDQYPEVD